MYSEEFPMNHKRWLIAALIGGLLLLGAYYRFDMRWLDFGTGDRLAYWSVPRAALLGHGFYDMAWLRATQVAHGYDPALLGWIDYPVDASVDPRALSFVVAPPLRPSLRRVDARLDSVFHPLVRSCGVALQPDLGETSAIPLWSWPYRSAPSLFLRDELGANWAGAGGILDLCLARPAPRQTGGRGLPDGSTAAEAAPPFCCGAATGSERVEQATGNGC